MGSNVDLSRHSNSKTYISFDTSTICPKKAAGKACQYCYVEGAREHGWRGKKELEYGPYNRFVTRLRDQTVERLENMGGLRMFSFADYRREHREDVLSFLNDCVLRGVRVKAITKQRKFLEDFGEHPAIAVIHVSIDSLGSVKGSPISAREAKGLRETSSRILVRAVALTMEEAIKYIKTPWVDIVTLYHGTSSMFHRFSAAEKASLIKLGGSKICCKTGTCSTCDIHCGVPVKKGTK